MGELESKNIGVKFNPDEYKILEELMQKWHINNYSVTVKRALGICHDIETGVYILEKSPQKAKEDRWNKV